MMHIEDPFGKPEFHKQYLGGWLGFGDYQAEIEGIKNHWMINPEKVIEMMKNNKFDEIKNDTRWKYTYHQRLYEYPFLDIEAKPRTINQIESLINKLEREPLSKSAQAITWDPRWDHNDGIMKNKIPLWKKILGKITGKKPIAKDVKWNDYDSPCLQRFWFRLVPFGDGYKLNVNGHWRSRDHLKAVPQNIYGVTEGMFEPVRKELQNALGVPVERGRYVDINDSLHFYGHYLDPRMGGLDAESYLQAIFNVAEGQAIEKRLVLPGTPMHDIYLEEIQKEYDKTVADPDYGRSIS